MVERGVDPRTPRFSGRNEGISAESGGIARNPVETKHQVDGLVRSRALSPGTLWKTPDADKKRTSNGASCPSAPALDRCPRQSRRRTDISSHQRACSRRSAAGSGRSRTRDYALRDQRSDVPQFAGSVGAAGALRSAITSWLESPINRSQVSIPCGWSGRNPRARWAARLVHPWCTMDTSTRATRTDSSAWVRWESDG